MKITHNIRSSHFLRPHWPPWKQGDGDGGADRDPTHTPSSPRSPGHSPTLSPAGTVISRFRHSTSPFIDSGKSIPGGFGFFRAWFTMGIGFSTCTLLGVSVVLILEFARSLLFHHTSRDFNLFSKLLFGFSPKFERVNIPFLDVGNLVFSTVVSVIVHEFEHALAAASEGIQMEYFAIFIAGLFLGALVAFNNDLLKEKSRSTALRIYCAGIWHNAICCAACGFALLLLPLIFSPLYIHDEGPMVLHLSSSSPVSSYLSPGDVIVSVDGIRIFNPQEWMEFATLIEERTFRNSYSFSSFQ
ncbi:Membrane-bound transcription factor site-2 protease-like protein [Drosera capensis]